MVNSSTITITIPVPKFTVLVIFLAYEKGALGSSPGMALEVIFNIYAEARLLNKHERKKRDICNIPSAVQCTNAMQWFSEAAQLKDT